jgi:hypothetical protein
MQNLVVDPGQRYCDCGALCEPTSLNCRKCRARHGWYRRKAWRVNNPARYRPDPGPSFTEEVITR